MSLGFKEEKFKILITNRVYMFILRHCPRVYVLIEYNLLSSCTICMLYLRITNFSTSHLNGDYSNDVVTSLSNR